MGGSGGWEHPAGAPTAPAPFTQEHVRPAPCHPPELPWATSRLTNGCTWRDAPHPYPRHWDLGDRTRAPPQATSLASRYALPVPERASFPGDRAD